MLYIPYDATLQAVWFGETVEKAQLCGRKFFMDLRKTKISFH